jgi:hypothetical protein
MIVIAAQCIVEYVDFNACWTGRFGSTEFHAALSQS